MAGYAKAEVSPWAALVRRVGQEDLLAAGITFVAILMFIASGVQVVPAAMRALFAAHGGSDRFAAVTLLLNIALLLFAWRRYKDLRAEAQKRRAAESRAELLSSRDQLTNMLIRGSISTSGNELLDELRARGEQIAVVVLNLDRFKNVNDVYGHIAGDAVLRGIAETIADLVPPDSLCARIGADEFAVLVPFCESARNGVSELADHIVEGVREPADLAGVAIHMTASIGVAASGRDLGTIDGLLRRANIAMHAAKQAGGNRCLWFDSSMESVLKARNEVETGLRRGIPLGEFVPYYQPQVDLATGEVLGFEALARWNHPAGGVVGPELFIPVGEETGLIADLFDSLFHRALCDARSWSSSLTLSVNVSPGQLKDPWLAHRILKILTEVSFPPERVEIEITESSLFENLAVAQAIVASLKNQGVKLALDDFGTGYSSLAHLRALPFDRIKIDCSFVQTMKRDASSLAIVTAVTSMSRSLGVPVTAEGVEDRETAEQLRALGCDTGQGWLFGKAVSAVDARAFLNARGLLLASCRDAQESAVGAPRRSAA